MIYLVVSVDCEFDKKSNSIISRTDVIKIGYTDDLKTRDRLYKSSGLFNGIIFSREGDLKEEALFHLYLNKYKYPKLNEWFFFRSDIIEDFKNKPYQEIYEYIYKNHKEYDNFYKSLYKKLTSDSKKIITDEILLEVIEKNKEDIHKELEEYRKNEPIGIPVEEDYLWKCYKFLYQDYLEKEKNEGKDKIISDFLDNYFYKTKAFFLKLKYYCEFMDKFGNDSYISDRLYYKIDNPKFRQFYNFYGTQGCKAKEYRENELDKGFYDNLHRDQLWEKIGSVFKVGDRMALDKIKKVLGDIYKDLGINRSPKASDLSKYFKLSSTKITMPDKSLKNGFILKQL